MKRVKKTIGILILLAGMLLAGCGEHECAICGELAGEVVVIAHKNINLCNECYREYIEIQHLFIESLD